MALPTILAIHGVANRDPNEFAARLGALAAATGRTVGTDLIPVFWGDLAPPGDAQFVSIPAAEDDASTLPAQAAVGLAPELGDLSPAPRAAALLQDMGVAPDPQTSAKSLADNTIQALQQRTGESVPPDTEQVIRQVLDEAATEQPLAVQADIHELLAEVVAVSPPTDSATLALGSFDAIKNRLKGVLDVFDQAAGRLIGDAIEHLFRGYEPTLSRSIATNFGDIETYQQDAVPIRARLDQAYQAARAQGADVHVVAHSLGGLVTVEWLLGAPSSPDGSPETPPADRKIRTLLTFGTQVGLFSELHGLRGSDPGKPVATPVPPNILPIQVERWLNVWHQLDPLAFVMHRALQISGNPTAPPIQDFRLELAGLPTAIQDFSFHSSYWSDPRFLAWAKGVLL